MFWIFLKVFDCFQWPFDLMKQRVLRRIARSTLGFATLFLQSCIAALFQELIHDFKAEQPLGILRIDSLLKDKSIDKCCLRTDMVD